VKAVTEYKLAKDIYLYGNDIITDERSHRMKSFIQHGTTTVFEHCVSVAKYSLLFAYFLENKLHMKIDKRSMVRGALLHDYFLYDWHIKGDQGYFHGYTHARRAFNNAVKDFELNERETDVILKHMFPLTPIPPRYKESALICIADKWCAICETFKIDVSSYIIYRVNLKLNLESGKIVRVEEESTIPA